MKKEKYINCVMHHPDIHQAKSSEVVVVSQSKGGFENGNIPEAEGEMHSFWQAYADHIGLPSDCSVSN